MGCSSFLKSPKKEEQEVPDGSVERVGILDDFEGFFGLEDEEKLPLDNIYGAQLDWDLMDLDEFSITKTNRMEEEEEDEEGEVFGSVPKACFFKEEGFSTKFIKTENVEFGVDDDGVEKVPLNLNLNYQEVLDAWSGRGSLWADDCSLAKASYGCYMGEVPVMEEERTRREACVLRYKEKRQTRLFSKKIRYQVRKLNADKRPRIKGRFVKMVS